MISAGICNLLKRYMMIAPAPDETPLRWISDTRSSETSRPAVPRRGPEAGEYHKKLMIFLENKMNKAHRL
jgi:hypothetical protein